MEFGGPCVLELWPRTGPATGLTFFRPPRGTYPPRDGILALRPIGNGLYQPAIMREFKSCSILDEEKKIKIYSEASCVY